LKDGVIAAIPRPTLSIVVPAFHCAAMLQQCLRGLQASTLPRSAWELIVVDDGSPDNTSDVARATANRVLRIDDGPRGPANARNLGARAARGTVLVFIDADVVVAPSTLSGFASHFAADPTLGAAFGAYDDAPAKTDFISQYRNLLHRYVHILQPGDADTFWAGCGAVRRDLFLAVGGFDSASYPRPQIEDIELGYRLRAGGARIILDPALTGTHLKRWTFSNMVRNDLRERAIPWMRLVLRRGELLHHGPLNLGAAEKLYTVLTALAAVALTLGVLLANTPLFAIAALCLAVVLLGNATLLSWFAARRGAWFAAGVAPLRLLYYLESGLGAAWAILSHRRATNTLALTPLQPITDGKELGRPPVGFRPLTTHQQLAS
jgi:GT2 family glycosyltransferase